MSVAAPSKLLPTALLAACGAMVSGCTVIGGYPADPENSAQVLIQLKAYFDPAKDAAYNADTTPATRQATRDTIVLNRMRAYDIEFASFEKRLWGTGNSVTLGGDLVALALGGLATTVTNAASKTAYAAAATGVVGANAAISRDLYYQRTLPALLAQMEANRGKVKLKILAGIKQSDSQYPLPLAEIDLADFKTAGSMASAIGNITQQASSAQQAAQAKIDQLRSESFSSSSTSKTLRAWVAPADVVNNDRMTMLQNWMNADAIDTALHGLPPEMLIDGDDPQMEADRVRAISALHIQ